MTKIAADPLDGLGLVLDPGPIEAVLADGVVLPMRRPTSLDWSRARAKVADVFDPLDKLRAASARYGFDATDRGALADPATWEGIGEFVIAVEIALLTVTAINREADGRRWSLEVSAAALGGLFKRNDNLDRFMARCREAERELLSPKKEPAPSPAGSTAAGASTAPGIDGSVTPAPSAD